MDLAGIDGPHSHQMKAASAESARDSKLRNACREFESLLVTQMLSKMRSTVPKNDLFGSSDEEEVFQDMLDQEIAKQVSHSGVIGIGDILYAQLSKSEKKG